MLIGVHMHIDGNLIPLFAIAVGLVIGVTRILTSTISNHKLRVEQIRAEAMVRAEDVRANNQLELKMLLGQDQVNTGTGSLTGMILLKVILSITIRGAG